MGVCGLKVETLTPRQSFTYFAKTLAVTIGVGGALLFGGNWAFRPYVDSRCTFADGPPVYALKFVQPHWLPNPDRWYLAETVVRCAVLGHGVVGIGVWWLRRRLKRPVSP